MVYCTPAEVRTVTAMTAADVTNTDLLTIITHATAQINRELGYLIIEEPVAYIDTYRSNKVDGVNKIFYTQSSRNYFIGDLDDDGDVDTNDVLAYVYDNVAKTITQVTVSAVGPATGAVTLTSVPASGKKVTLTYRRFPLDASVPDKALKYTCVYLTAAMAHLKIKGEDFPKLRLGDLSIDSYSKVGDAAFNSYFAEYKSWINKISSGTLPKMGFIKIPPYMETYTGQP